jgi:hypothetical protein
MGGRFLPMQIRTKEEFIDCVARERAWRVKELAALKNMLELSDLQPGRRDALNKSSIALLYAHWEGFVKKAGGYFLEYVAMQRLNLNELQPCFISLIFKSRIDEASASKKYSVFGDIAVKLIGGRDTKITVPYKNTIDTQSNLSSSVLREILLCLGLDYSFYEPKQKWIDAKLVNRRNHVAHGNDLGLDTDDVLAMFEEVISLIDLFRNLIENSAVTAGYKRTVGAG